MLSCKSMSKVNFKEFVAQCVEELRLKTEAHDGVWRLSEADWELDQDAGTIVFTTPNGIVATCPVQIIGTYDSLAESWMWGWDHPSVDPALQLHAKKVRALGLKNNREELTTQKINITESEAWELTALACKINEAQGAYRGPAGSTFVYVTFGTPTLNK